MTRRPDPHTEHERTPSGYRERRAVQPFADVVPQPPRNPPLGELPADALLVLTQAERVAVESQAGHRRGLTEPLSDRAAEHDARVDRLVETLHRRPDSDAA
ncbi:MAG: hypothetical protein L0I76_31185 [Pseudonocardia sp.]|nr:hypothetical protein [Pseudonocardia sp.]